MKTVKRQGVWYQTNVTGKKYKSADDSVIINDLIDFTNKTMLVSAETMFTLSKYVFDSGIRIQSNRIEWGQMVGYHHHDFYEFNCVFRSKVYEIINGEVVVLKEGDLLFMHPSTFHSLFPNPSARAVNFLMSADLAESLSRTFSAVAKDNFFSCVVDKRAYVVLNTEKAPEIGKELDRIDKLT